jgi:beta-xylosidase
MTVEALKFWNEPNNLSHWDFGMDPEWREFAAMTTLAARRAGELAPHVRRVLGGMSPIDVHFLKLLGDHGTLDHLDVVAVHGFPLDWNHWKLDEWPDRIAEIEAATPLPVWVTEVGVSTFGADEVQVFGLRRTAELLKDRVERVFWYSLFDLPKAWPATTRHRESEGSSYYRHFYMGLVREDNTPKPAVEVFDPALGICQWFHWHDHRLEAAVEWLKRLGVRKLRTGISWADWNRPEREAWFDRQMDALADFDLTITLCFTPPSRGRRACHTSPPQVIEEFAWFTEEIVRRYVLQEGWQPPATRAPRPGRRAPAAPVGVAEAAAGAAA